MRLVILLSMCVCVFASNVAVQAPFNELKEMWQGVLMDYIDNCIDETGADRALAERILPYGEYAENKKLKCFAKCVCAGLHMVGEDAAAHHYDFLDKLRIVDPKLRIKVIKKCVNKVPIGDDCAKAFYTSKCVYFVVKKALSEGIDAVDDLKF